MENSEKYAGAEDNVLLFTVDGKEYKSHEQYLTGAQIRKIVGAPDESLECLLFLSVPHPWIDELVKNDEPVDLARPEIEHFYFKNVLLFTINGSEYISDKQYISGAEVRKLGGLQEHDELFLAIKKPWPDEPVPADKEINLARPGIEHFFSNANPNVKLTIQTPKGNWTDSFNKKLTVQQLIEKVIAKFGFAADGNYALKIKGTTENMVPSHTIESYNLPSGQILVFTDLGKGA